ncbi:MAG TPA: DUF962 domain-containing protein [Rhodopila sp.]|jgi:hypothetical protein|nr:DUF962 domain-containing protein [Rhodopila sp.]
MTYGEFWKIYLQAHKKPGTRALHFAGSFAAIVLALCAIITLDWRFLIAAAVVGYAFAWTGHFAIERNRPATFGHPFWSFFSDFRMLGLWCAGRLESHLSDAGLQRRG